MRETFGGRIFDVFVHQVDVGLIVEFETVAGKAPEPIELFPEIQANISRLQNTDNLQALLDLTCSEIRRITGYERVMAYKFLEDGSGRM